MVDRYARLDNNQRGRGRRRATAIAALLMASAPAAMHAQLLMPPVSVTVTNPPPTTSLVTDPVTGQPTTMTSRQVIIDVKHTNNPQTNWCTGEEVLINGNQKFWFIIDHFSSSGRVLEKFHEQANGTGNSVTLDPDDGVKYSFATSSNSQASYGGPSLTATNTSTIQQHLVRSGEIQESATGDDWFIKTVLHTTVVNNVPTAFVEKVEFPCR